MSSTAHDTIVPKFVKPSKHQVAVWSYRLTLIMQALQTLGMVSESQIVLRDMDEALRSPSYATNLEIKLLKWEERLFDQNDVVTLTHGLAYTHRVFEALLQSEPSGEVTMH